MHTPQQLHSPILFAGDVHGNIANLDYSLHEAAQKRIHSVIQVGDFWLFDTKEKLQSITRHLDYYEELHGFRMHVYFIDGNHENFTYDAGNHTPLWHYLTSAIDEYGEDYVYNNGAPITNDLTYLPRGSVLTTGSHTIGFLGGAYSIDKEWRIEGKTWFPEEEITYEDYERAHRNFNKAGGIDILVTHDTTTEGFLRIIYQRGEGFGISDYDASRDYITRIANEFTPTHHIHGHHHYAAEFTIPVGDGEKDMRVHSLNLHGEPGAFFEIVD